MRPITCSWDPVGMSATSKSKHESFKFLEDAISNTAPGLENCNVFDPRSLGVPWPTSLPAAAQCKYWREAEEAATALMNQIVGETPDNQGSLPAELANSSSKAAKRKELLDTAVSAPMNMFPAGNARRARIMAKANLLIFMHDDVIESKSNEQLTIIDTAFVDTTGTKDEGVQTLWKNKIFQEFAAEVNQEDPIAGPVFLKGILNWVQHTREQLPGSMRFSSFSDYIDYRILDFAVDYCDAALMLTCEIFLSPADMEPLSVLHRLYLIHFSLTNDLYSYDKEMYSEKESGAAVINAARVLEQLLNASPREAKFILRAFIWELEIQIDEEFKRLLGVDLTPAQQRFARGMIEAISGNLFYSATCLRYAKPTLRDI